MSDKEEQDGPKLEKNKSPISRRKAKKMRVLSEYLSKQESRNTTKMISNLLKKGETELTEEEKETLAKNQNIVLRIHRNQEKRMLLAQRTQEIEDTEEELKMKCYELAQALKESTKTVIYTGAGISTAASIPDYRGPQGVWTLLQKGEELKPQDLSDANPTTTHMCITDLFNKGHVTHVVSQNCDGLHVRSGMPRKSLSEVHGNMYIEMCYSCKPHRQYIRLFDVTEKTGVRRHQTGRVCHVCKGKLKDTIVHFGEKGQMKSPYRWKEATKAANKCDLILCLGSSLKILKNYACLWCMDRNKLKRPKLIIVNLQWTPKDEAATMKINGRCDDVMMRVMKILGFPVPVYNREVDPIFKFAVPLLESEKASFAKKTLIMPESVEKQLADKTLNPKSQCLSDSEPETSSSESEESDSDDDSEYFLEKLSKEKGNFKLSELTEEERELMLQKKCLVKSQKICNDAKQVYQKKIQKLQKGMEDGQSTSAHKPLLISEFLNNQVATIKETQKLVSKLENAQNLSAAAQNSNKDSQESGEKQSPEQAIKAELKATRSKRASLQLATNDGLTYEERLAQLQMLQTRLQVLKEKQKIMSHQPGPGPQQATQGLTVKEQNQASMYQAQINQMNQALANAQVQKQASTPTTGPMPMDREEGAMTDDEIKAEIDRLEKLKKSYEEKQRQEFKQRVERERLDLKRQHGNEYMRLSQHYLQIQQAIDQQGLGPLKNAENMRGYEEQQRLLVNRQNQQTQDLQRQHQEQEVELQSYMDKFCHGIVEKINQLKANMLRNQGHGQSGSSYNMGMKGMRMPPVSTVGGMGIQNTVNPMYENVSYNQNAYYDSADGSSSSARSPTQTDHSISAIIHTTSGQFNPEAPQSYQTLAAIPDFGELVPTLTTCEICKSQIPYQPGNNHCPFCQDLRLNPGLSQPQNLANFQSTSNFDQLQSSSFVPNQQYPEQQQPVSFAYNPQYGAINQAEQGHSMDAYTKVKPRSNQGPHYSHSDTSKSNTNQSYLQLMNHPMQNNFSMQQGKGTECVGKDSYGRVSNKHGRPSSTTTRVGTMSAATSQSMSNVPSELELSPVIPYASRKAKKQTEPPPLAHRAMSSNQNIAIDHKVKMGENMHTGNSSLKMSANYINGKSDIVNRMGSSARSGYSEGNGSADVRLRYADGRHGGMDVDKDGKVLSVYETGAAKFAGRHEEASMKVAIAGAEGDIDYSTGRIIERSHSQSELFDQTLDDLSYHLKSVRSRSQGEILSAMDEDKDLEDSVSGDGSPSEDGKMGRKRKIQPSVPGWFGKGLNLKKKKRY